MSWRTVIIDSLCKISYKNDYLYIKKEDVQTIHLTEIGLIIIGSIQVNITAFLLVELCRRKIKVVFCDECHNPYSEIVPYYGCYDSSRKIEKQMSWHRDLQIYVADLIIEQKIKNQATLLKKYNFSDESEMLTNYANALETNDATNREGHSAKVYFNALFGKSFTRDYANDTNAKLDYGYAILLSTINKEVVANGCLTQLGLKHHNEYNHFNLSCDIIEPWRVIIDEYVFTHSQEEFNSDYKYQLVNLLNNQIMLEREYYLSNAIAISVRSVIETLNQNDTNLLRLYQFK